MYLAPSFCKPVDVPAWAPNEPPAEDTTLATERHATREIERLVMMAQIALQTGAP